MKTINAIEIRGVVEDEYTSNSASRWLQLVGIFITLFLLFSLILYIAILENRLGDINKRLMKAQVKIEKFENSLKLETGL